MYRYETRAPRVTRTGTYGAGRAVIKTTYINFVVSAVMLILFDVSHCSRHFSSLLISSAKTITLSFTQVERACHLHLECILYGFIHFKIIYED